MAMNMTEFFYGDSVPAYFAHYGGQVGAGQPSFYEGCEGAPMPEFRNQTVEVISVDLMVPLCCDQCEDLVREALFDLRTVRDVVCDGHSQRVTVTGCMDPAQALQQVRLVKDGAMFWSDAIECSAHRYPMPSRSERRSERRSGGRRSRVRFDLSERRLYPGQYSRNSSSDEYARDSSSDVDEYSRDLCQSYRDTAKTYYINLDHTIGTVEYNNY
ncbi:hypothetical protein M758_1G079500 [Ceratodon purpureus]|uniref:HMA domain-containing protein n=1 Tax=Ceratodon purpureus TaxID=3225 RepID=A0A8T0J2S7_CERPU|nr:hypothetical protein KC19_1G081400 [Ceratodon purpureus]KAG0629125.1 hypothetical protein M758_1G078700 [Ceratodon purpureus]KAG0629140.1 hypothetical protein M758_1G079500 [Ceratodon purpureus]